MSNYAKSYTLDECGEDKFLFKSDAPLDGARSEFLSSRIIA